MFPIYSCEKNGNEPTELENLEPYIRNLIQPDSKPPYTGNYYIHVKFTDLKTLETKELTFSELSQTMTVWNNPTNTNSGMLLLGTAFSDSETWESLIISFYFDPEKDTTFNICYANYYFSEPFKKVAGANIEYLTPIDDFNPYNKCQYMGTNSSEYYFKITYIGNNRLNGEFYTKWKDSSGENSTTTYDVYGDFSIPDIRYFINK